MYICKDKQVTNSWYKGERDWSVPGGSIHRDNRI